MPLRARYSGDGGATGGFVRQASTVATLSALSVNGVSVAGFDADRVGYRAGVAAAVATATVAATATDAGASVGISGTDSDTTTPGHQVALSAGANSVTVTVTAADTTTTKAYTVAVNRGVTTEYGWKASEDLDGLGAAGNGAPRGVWSDGTTVWVSDNGSTAKLYAYKASDKTRDSAKDFDTLDGAGNDHPYGIWSDGTTGTMWVVDYWDKKIYAYDMATKARDSSKDFDTLDGAGNDNPGGIWSDGTTMWVDDSTDDRLYAYDMATKARVSSKDFGALEGARNNQPAGIWSDGATMWVVDTDDGKLYAYDMATKAHVSSRDFGTLAGAGAVVVTGVWSDGTTMWVGEAAAVKVFSFNLPVYAVSAAVDGTSLEVVFSQDLATAAPASSAFTVKKTTGSTEEAVTLSGSPAVSDNTLTLTLSAALASTDTAVKVSYAKPVSGNKLANSGGNEVSAFTDLAVDNNTVPTVITAPGAPTGLTATARGPARIDLAWTAPSSDGGASISGYKIEVSTNGGTSFTDLVASHTGTSYSHTGLAANSTRHYRVSATNSVGTGAVSNTASDVTNVFVRNLAQGNHEDNDTALGLSQRFTTGPNAAGYTLTSVEIVSGDADGDDFTADIFAVDTATGHPTGSGTRLVAPGNFAAGTLTFTAPADTRLAAGTTYALVVETIGSESVVYERTTSTAEDSGGASSWGIENTYEWKDISNTWRDDADARSLRIALRGVNRTASSDATLSALTVSPKDIIGFDADRDSYEVGVASTVAAATVMATATHSGATVNYSGTDADTVAVGHQVDLTAGRNEVTVTVTAEDTTTTEEYTVSVNRGVATEYGWKASEDLDGLIAADNYVPHGVWSDGATIWVSDGDESKLYAYKASDKTRDSSKDFNTLDAAGNDEPRGIWSDGTTMWVADSANPKLYAYDMATKAYDSSKDFNTLSLAGNGDAGGIWSDGATMWVADRVAGKLFAYDMATRAYDSSKDFDTLSGPGNNGPFGIWSDEVTMWVADSRDDKIYAYGMATKAYDSSKDFDTLSASGGKTPHGLWSDGTTMWAASWYHEKLFSYSLPVYAVSAAVSGASLVVTFSQDLATTAPASTAFGVKKTTGSTESAVSLTGSPTISGKKVTLTLTSAVAAADTDVKVSYAKPVSGNKLANSGGNEVTGFTDLAVTNSAATTAPGQPISLTATAAGPSQIDLVWTAPASDGGATISGYKIETSANGTTFTTLTANTSSTATTYSHTSLTANTTRHYRVSAINSVGTGPVSAAASDITNVFVRNTGQGSGTTHSSGSDQSQRFTTGAHVGGYTLAGVEIVSADGESDDFTAEIWTVDTTTGHPSARHAVLAPPGDFAAGTLRFAAPAGTTLDAGTTYAVVTSLVGGGDVTYSGTTSDGEDAGFVSGWAIHDDHEYKSGGAWTDNGSNRSLRIAVRGTPKTGNTTGGGGTVGGGGAVSGAARGTIGGGGSGDFDVGVATFVVANGWSPPDIGAASVLAARTADAVVAYTAGDDLSQATAELLREAQPAKVIIVGGIAAVPSDVRAQIRSASPGSRLERIDGADRAHTAAAVARRVLGSPSDAGRVTVIVANGSSPPDIGAAAALAARSGRSAVLYTQHDSLPEPTAELLRDYQILRVILIGGTAAISDETQASVAAAADDDASITRLTGADRVDTATQAARRVLGNPAAAPRDITLVIANGWSPPDVGVAAALAAATPNAAVAYTEHATLPAATRTLIADYKPTTIIIIGGTTAIANDVRTALTDTAPDGAAIRRISGDTRTHTAARAARRILSGP